MGEADAAGRAVSRDRPAAPRDPYGRGKLAIERALRAAAQETGIEIVILRPPLVYGPGVKANFRALLRLVASGLPLPFAGIDNRRSLIFLDNLVDLDGRAVPASRRRRAGVAGARRRRSVDPRADPAPRRRTGPAGAAFRVSRDPPWPRFAGLPMLGPLLARLTLSLQVDDRGDPRRARLAAAGLARNRARSDRTSLSPAGRNENHAGRRGVLNAEHSRTRPPWPPITEDTVLIRQALAYVIELYRELSEENGAPSLGTQNQVVDFILADPELRAAVAHWADRRERRGDDRAAAAAAARCRLPADQRLSRSIMGQPVFTRPGQEPPDRR